MNVLRLHHDDNVGVVIAAEAKGPGMKEDMDIDCGTVLDGCSIEEKGREKFDTILDVASGRRTKSEDLGLGDNEFVLWQIGAMV